jgi:Domain of unknown function (DUF4174)
MKAKRSTAYGWRLAPLAMFSLLLSMTQAAPAASLDYLLGSRPVILLFAKSRSDAALDKEIGLFSERRPELEERNAVVIMITDNRDAMAVVGYATIEPGTGRLLRREFEPGNAGLTVVLVGRNGQELGRWNGVVSPDAVFDVIDAGPESDNHEGVRVRQPTLADIGAATMTAGIF